MCAAGDVVPASHALPTGDDWLGVPTSSRPLPNFCSWLNKESFQLQQTGQRYRVNELTDRRLVDRQCPATSANPGTYLRDVSRTRLHSDSGDASRNVRFDAANTAAMSQDHTHADDVKCASNHTAGVINHK